MLFVNPFADLSGPEQVVLRLMAGLDKQRFASALVCPRAGRLSEAAQQYGFKVSFVPLEIPTFGSNLVTQGYNAVVGAQKLARIISSGGFDIVHLNSHRIGLPCTLAARLAGAKALWHIHEIYQTTRPRRSIIVGLVRTCADAVVAVSDAVAAQFHPCRKLHRIYNGISAEALMASADRDATRRELGIGQQDVLVGCMGRLSRQKGHDDFLRAARLVSDIHENARFLIVGDEALGEAGFGAHLEGRSRELGLGEKVIFTGFRRDPGNVLAAMDVFVHPSIIPDSLPNTILEAMALGLPIVATSTGGTPELVGANEAGFLVPPSEPAALAARIGELIAAPELSQTLGLAAKSRVEERFSAARHFEQFESVYEGLADGVGGDRFS